MEIVPISRKEFESKMRDAIWEQARCRPSVARTHAMAASDFTEPLIQAIADLRDQVEALKRK